MSGLNEGNARTWRGMTHAERRLRHNIDVMTDMMDRFSRDVKELRQTLKLLAETLVASISNKPTATMDVKEAPGYVVLPPWGGRS